MHIETLPDSKNFYVSAFKNQVIFNVSLMVMKRKKWKIEGYDTFDSKWDVESDPFYPIEGEWNTEKEAIEAAKKFLDKIERHQPSSRSGGQSILGLQDHVYIVRPDGSKYRYIPNGMRLSRSS